MKSFFHALSRLQTGCPSTVIPLGFLLGIIFALLPSAARGQSFWEMTPYRIHVIVALAPVPDLGPRVEADLLSGLVEQAEAVVGPAWDLEVEPATGALRYRLFDSITAADDVVPVEIETRLLEYDKVITLAVRMAPDRFEIVAREFDCRTRRWELPVVGEARQTTSLREEVFRTLLRAFSPLARIEINADRQTILKPRAARRPVRDPSLRWFQEGDVFQPIIRRNNRDGELRDGRTEPLPWSFLVIREVGASGIVCELFSGTRQSLRARRRGRVEQIALAVKAPAAPTRLLLEARDAPGTALAGYDIYARGPNATESQWVGRTDDDGAVVIPPNEHPLRILFVKNGNQLLARLPLVPGLTPTAVAAMADDNVRLEAEGLLTGLREELIDLVARREMLVGQIYHRLDADDFAGADQKFETLRRLPTREQFLAEVDQLVVTKRSTDPQVQRKLDGLFNETRTLITKYLDPRRVFDVQNQLNQNRKVK